MVDHHVDRPGVKAGQPAQLTGPNHPIELSNYTILHSNHPTNRHQTHTHSLSFFDLHQPVGLVGRPQADEEKQRAKPFVTSHPDPEATQAWVGWTTWWP